MKRMKSDEVRKNWADVLLHVRTGGEVIVEHYNKPIADVVPHGRTLRLTADGPGSRQAIEDYVRAVIEQRTTVNNDTSAERLARGITTSILHRLGAGYTTSVRGIVPTEEPAMTFTSNDLRDQVTRATDASDGEYDVQAIVDEIVERYGAVPVDDIESTEFWEIVGKHEGSPVRDHVADVGSENAAWITSDPEMRAMLHGEVVNLGKGRIQVSADGHEILSGLGESADGLISDGKIWFEGDGYALIQS